jgi:hypothetical protein
MIPRVNLLKHSKADFIQNHRDMYRDHSNEFLQCDRKIGLNSEYSIGKCEFAAKKQSWWLGGVGGGINGWMENN